MMAALLLWGPTKSGSCFMSNSFLYCIVHFARVGGYYLNTFLPFLLYIPKPLISQLAAPAEVIVIF